MISLIEATTAGTLAPVLSPSPKAAGCSFSKVARAFHFFNTGAMVNVDVTAADTGEMHEGRRHCFRFDAPLDETAALVVTEIFRTNTPAS